MAIHAATRSDDASTRTTATATGETLTAVAANHAATNAVCSTNLPNYVFTRPTSTVTRIAFAATRSALIVARPTRVAIALVYISTGSTFARAWSRSSLAVASPNPYV